MDPQAILDEAGQVIGWSFAPEESDEAEISAFDDWIRLGYVDEDGVQ